MPRETEETRLAVNQTHRIFSLSSPTPFLLSLLLSCRPHETIGPRKLFINRRPCTTISTFIGKNNNPEGSSTNTKKTHKNPGRHAQESSKKGEMTGGHVTSGLRRFKFISGIEIQSEGALSNVSNPTETAARRLLLTFTDFGKKKKDSRFRANDTELWGRAGNEFYLTRGT